MKTIETASKNPKTISCEPPSHLSAPSKVFWASVVADFELESDALMVLRIACEQFDRAQQARRDIAKNGFTLIGGKPNPALAVEKQAVSLFYRGLRQLGLDVAAPGEKPGRKF